MSLRCESVEFSKLGSFRAARKPAYQLRIDFGPHGERQSSAQLTALYQTADLVGRLVIAVTNFPARRVAVFDRRYWSSVFRTKPATSSCLSPSEMFRSEARIF